MNKRKLILAVAVSVLLPGIDILGHNIIQNPQPAGKLVVTWLSSSAFLFALWMVNQLIAKRTAGKEGSQKHFFLLFQFFCSLLFIVVFTAVEYLFVPIGYRIGATVPPWLVVFKFLVGFVLIIIIQHTLYALEQNEAIKLTNARLQNENLEARLQSLKQQINPHFLFNALSTLRTMVRGGDANAEKFIMNLSEVYRQLLSKSDAATITLAEEAEFLQSYLFMLQARFENTLKVTMDLLPESQCKKLPAFSLQLLAENCIKHNIVSAARPLHVKIYQSGPECVTVENNLQVKTSTQKELPGMGLNNLEKRYELLGVQNGVTTIANGSTYKVVLKLLA